ncbi:MAG: acyl-CoA dehydrogenase family protein [Acetobacteraceae bacterium]|nr:acyl-CoA dehydrogenase family protein [Acetobacteraceae bacterium]
MDVLLNEDEAAVQAAAAAFLSTEATPALVRAAERSPERISRDLWAKVVELGWLGISLPEECGGQGLPLSYLGLLFEELGRQLAPIPMLSTTVAALILARHGSPAQRDVLRQVVEGTLILTYAVQERDCAWSAEAVALTGAVVDGQLVLTGEKAFVDNFRSAGQCLTAFRMKGRGLALAMVDTAAPGISVTDLVTTAGDAQTNVRFDDVRVPLTAMVGDPASGRAIVLELMDLAAAFTTALMVGAAGEATHRAVEYAKNRNAFGQPIGSFQAIQHMAADMTIGVDGAQLLVREALYRLSHGLPARVEVAQAKAFASGKCLAAVRMAQQIHGGIGFIAEFDQQLWYRRVAAWSLRCGTALEHRSLVAESLLDRQGPVRLGYDQSVSD